MTDKISTSVSDDHKELFLALADTLCRHASELVDRASGKRNGIILVLSHQDGTEITTLLWKTKNSVHIERIE